MLDAVRVIFRGKFILLNALKKKNYLYTLYTIAQLIKNPLAVQETLVQPLGREDPLEEG